MIIMFTHVLLRDIILLKLFEFLRNHLNPKPKGNKDNSNLKEPKVK